jgi:hypothetical protein
VRVNVVVVYESLTGNTHRAADLIGTELTAAGATVTICPITTIDFQALADADLVVVGSWTDGFFVVGQRPGRAGRLRQMPVIDGKKSVVYCTYALNPGKTLEKLAEIVASRGGDVVGGMAIRRDDIPGGVHEFVGRLLDVIPV